MRKWRVQFTHLAKGRELRFLEDCLYFRHFPKCFSLFTHLISFCSPERMVALALLIRRRNFEIWRSKETCVKVHTWNWQNQIGTQDFRHGLFAHPCCLLLDFTGGNAGYVLSSACIQPHGAHSVLLLSLGPSLLSAAGQVPAPSLLVPQGGSWTPPPSARILTWLTPIDLFYSIRKEEKYLQSSNPKWEN